MAIQAQIDQATNIVLGISETNDYIVGENYIPINEYDITIIGKKWNGTSFVEIPHTPQQVLQITKLAFLRRFTAEERIAIRASTDPVIVDFLHLLDLAQEVRLDDADTQAGVRHLESVGLLAAGRAEAILAPEQA